MMTTVSIMPGGFDWQSHCTDPSIMIAVPSE